jgi:predicted nucleic-acid-binding protein
MKAVDTNVLARYILSDDPVQSPLAFRQLREPCFVSETVLLECAWLLSSKFDMDRPMLAASLRHLLDLPALTVRNPQLLSWAIDRFAAGADLADMIHIVDAGPVDAFVSFERRLKEAAGPDAPIPVERLG